MRAEGVTEELIAESDSHSDSGDADTLAARARFAELQAKYKAEIAQEADKVRQAGGLLIIGTERHESRRIDNQLRGRSGRQGDPGATRFFLSLEDDLMRLFGGGRIQNIMDTLKIEDDMPIENTMLSGSIESAQRKVEGRNFGIRKNVLQFDDVMNRQREIIYGQRAMVLDGQDLTEYIVRIIDDVVDSAVDQFLAGSESPDDWNLDGLRDHFKGWVTDEQSLRYNREQLSMLEPETIRIGAKITFAAVEQFAGNGI